MMIVIPEKEFVILFFREMFSHETGELINELFDLFVVEPGNQGGKECVAAEKAQKDGQGLFIRGPVQAKTDRVGGKGGIGHVHAPSRSFHQTLRLRGPSNSQKKIRCQVPSLILPASTKTVTELPARVAIMWEGELPSP